MTVIKTAVENKMRPLAMLYRLPDPYGEWVPLDYRLVYAYQQLKDETCQECGNPLWLCHSTDPDIDWKVDTTKCYATEAIEARRWRDDNKGKRGGPPREDVAAWGRNYFAVPKLLPTSDRTELPSREDYMI